MFPFQGIPIEIKGRLFFFHAHTLFLQNSIPVYYTEPCHYCVKEANTDYETFALNSGSHQMGLTDNPSSN